MASFFIRFGPFSIDALRLFRLITQDFGPRLGILESRTGQSVERGGHASRVFGYSGSDLGWRRHEFWTEHFKSREQGLHEENI
jgi:hypothetical protein